MTSATEQVCMHGFEKIMYVLTPQRLCKHSVKFDNFWTKGKGIINNHSALGWVSRPHSVADVRMKARFLS